MTAFSPIPHVRPERHQHIQHSADLDLLAVASAVWHRRYIIAACIILSVLCGTYAFIWTAVPQYRATASLILETREGTITDIRGVVTGMTGDAAELNSEVEILRSPAVLEQVVEQLELTNDPEFNSALRFQTGVSALWTTVADVRTPDQIRTDAILALRSRISIQNIPLSYVFEVSVTSQSAAKAALIADTLVSVYISQQVQEKQLIATDAIAWLAQRVGELEVELAKAEIKTADFEAKTSLVSSEAIAAQRVQLKDVRSRIEALLAVASSQTQADQVSALRASEKMFADQIGRQSQDLVELQQLTREADAIRALYEHFLGRHKEMAAQQGIQAADSRMLSQALVPQFPTTPKKGLVLTLSVLLGIFAGLLATLILSLTNNRFQSPDAVEAESGYPVIGQIPVIPGVDRSDILGYLSAKPASRAAEAVRNLRTSLLLSNIDSPPGVIAFTSALPSEGKTTNALALAHNLVSLGNRVLLLEGDMRRRTFERYFAQAPVFGMVSVMSGDIAFAEAVFRPAEIDADVLMCGAPVGNAADIFSSHAFASLLTEARSKYDFIIIDTPPVLVVPDARVISVLVDATLMSVKWNSTTRAQLNEALRIFHQSNVKISGIVLSQIGANAMEYSSAYRGVTAEYYQS